MKKKINENTQITNMTQITHKTSIYVQMTQNEYRAHKVDTFGKNTNVAENTHGMCFGEIKKKPGLT